MEAAFPFQEELILIKLEPYPLKLRSAFGTSHSLTDSRLNALITIRAFGAEGWGEIGLPPKKPGCYEANFDDIEYFFKTFVTEAQPGAALASIDPSTFSDHDPFSLVKDDGKYFSSAKAHLLTESKVTLFFRYFFHCLDNCSLNYLPLSRPARCGIECAAFDLWSKLLRKHAFTFFTNENEAESLVPTPTPSFYTIALNPDMQKLVDTVKFGLQWTSHLKVKLDDNVARGDEILSAIAKEIEQSSAKDKNIVLTIDANSSWTPSVARAYLPALLKHKQSGLSIEIIEQPFPLSFLKDDLAGTSSSSSDCNGSDSSSDEWKAVKAEYNANGFLVFADESISTEKDVHTFKDFVDGVNVKLEKAGGYRSAVSAICAARSYGLKVWIGSMVGSVLLANGAIQLMPLADFVDVDGALLTDLDSQKFTGGFLWAGAGCDTAHLQHFGHAVLVAGEALGVGVSAK